MREALGIPAIEDMAQFRQWVLHGADKVPLRVDGNGRAKSTDPTTWSELRDALDGLQRGRGVGLGFVFSESDPYVGIDLDNAVHDDGSVKPWAQKIVDLFDGSYTEISLSGRGLHIITRGQLPDGWTGNSTRVGDGHVEIYCEKRYFTMTLNVLDGHTEARKRNIQLAKFGYDYGFLTPTPVPPEPARLANSGLAARPFPLEVFPEYAQKFAKAVAATTKTSVDAVAFVLLAAASAIVGLWTEVRITTNWVELCHLFACLVARSGDRKTAIFKLVNKPLELLETEIREEAEHVVQDARSMAEVLETKIAGLKNGLKQEMKKVSSDPQTLTAIEESMKTLAAELEEAKAVRSPTLVVSDCTSEKLVMLLAENSERLALVSGDTPFWGLVSGRYTEGAPRIEIFLSAHSGEAYRDHRVSRAENVLKEPRLAISIGTQPCVIRDLQKKPELDNRGLISRFVFCKPPTMRGFRDTTLVNMPDGVESAYVLRMLALGRKAREHGVSVRLSFSNEAAEEFEQWHADLEPRLRPGEDLASLSSFPDKLPATIARIAGLLHVLQERKGTEIGRDTFEDAAKVVDFLIDQFRNVFDLIGRSPSSPLAGRIRDWVQSEGLHTFTRRQCQHDGPGQRHTVEQIQEALEELENEDFLRLAKERPSGRGKETVRATVL